MRIFSILIIIILSVFYTSLAKAECIYKSDLFGKRIGIVGDSFFTTKDGFGNLENVLELTFHASNVQNSAAGGATLLGFGKKAIGNQPLDKPLDLLILGGGANDFVKCGKDTKCQSQKLNWMISPGLTKGEYNKIINNHSNSETKSVILYNTVVGNHAPEKWQYMIKSGLASKYAERMSSFADVNPNIMWFDAGKILNPNNREHWLDDGYHPSMHGYKLIAKELFNRLCKM